MIAFISLILLFFTLVGINSASYLNGIQKCFMLLVSLSMFVIIFNNLPLGFASDQEDYYNLLTRSNLESQPYKTFILGVISFIPVTADFSLIALRLFLYILCISAFIYFGEKICNSPVKAFSLILIPSIAIHATLFLREPIIYAVIIGYLFFLVNKRLFLAVICWILVALIRADTAIIIFPVFLIVINNNSYQSFLAFSGILATYFMLNNFEPLNFIFNSYRNQYGIEHNILDSFSGLLFSASNFFFGSRDFQIATIMLSLESFLMIYILYFAKNKTILISLLLLSILIIGSISDNSGFILRIRSSIVLIFVVLYFFEIKSIKVMNKIKNNQRINHI